MFSPHSQYVSPNFSPVHVQDSTSETHKLIMVQRSIFMTHECFLNLCWGAGGVREGHLPTATAAGGFPAHHCSTWQAHSSTLLPGFCRHLICNLELVGFKETVTKKVLNGSASTLGYASLLFLFSPNPPLLTTPRKIPT